MDAKENLIRVIKREKPEYVPYYAGDRLDKDLPLRRVNYKGNSIAPEKEGVDWWGVHWAPMGSEGEAINIMHLFPVKVPLDKIKKIDDYQFPDPDKFELKEGSKQLLQDVERNEILLFGCDEYCLMERALFSCGMENFLLALYTEPKRVKKLLHGIANYHIGIARHYLALGIDCFFNFR